MALLAGCRQYPRMGRVGRALVIGLVTAVTVGIGAQLAVVKERSGKGGRGVAIATGMCEIHRHVIWRFLIIRLMAGVAVHRRPAKIFGIGSWMALDA